MRVEQGKITEVTIDRLEPFEGRGVARLNGLAIFVPLTVPGDSVQIKIVKLKKSHAEGEMIKLLKPGLGRVDPPCKYVLLGCGGCCWQQVDYQEQLRQKQLFLEFAFRDFPNIGNCLSSFVLASPQEFGYRNRIQLQSRFGKVGYFARKTNDHIPIATCMLADARISKQMNNDNILGQIKNDTNIDKVHLEIENSFVKVEALRKGETASFGFSQVNECQNRNLIDLTIEAIEKSHPAVLYDLYCGAGNFSFPIRKAFPAMQVVGVELNKKSIELAVKRQASLTGIEAGATETHHNSTQTEISFVNQDVKSFLMDQSHFEEKSLVLVDPPRAGCENLVIAELIKLTPETIIYISCNLASLRRDIVKLAEKYEPKQIQGLDMFPQTQHLEVFCVLVRKPL